MKNVLVYQGSTGYKGSPFSIISCVRLTTAWKKGGCRKRACRNRRSMQENCLIRRLTVSCLAKIFFFFSSPFGLTKKLSSQYPLSAKAFSPGSRRSTKSSRASFISDHFPHGKPPWAQTMFPVRMQRPTSYRSPGPRNLCEYHFGSNTVGSKIRKSVPSRETRGDVPGCAFS